MPHLTALLALSIMQCQRRLQICQAKNIGNVLEQSGVAFRLAPPYAGLLVAQCQRTFLTDRHRSRSYIREMPHSVSPKNSIEM